MDNVASTPGPAMPLGERFIPDHELIAPIASGAYGEVWLARNAVGTLRAVKIVRRDQHASAESFEREFKGLQKFEPVSRAHDGLVDILTLGLLPDGAGFYYVMELADQAATGPNIVAAEVTRLTSSESEPKSEPPYVGCYIPRTLRADLKSRGALPANEVIALGLKLASALAHLHTQGLVHRDVKPSNILFIGGEPKLADAGLVAAMDDARSLVGTAGYIAPEGPGTPQADLYALGKVLYEAAFGKDRQEFPALPADVASRPDHARLLELNAVLLKTCATDHHQRYATADEMCVDLELVQRGKSVQRQQSFQRGWALFRKFALISVVLAGVVASATILWRQTSRPARPGDGSLSRVFDANTLCERAMLIIRGDHYDAFPEAYTNFNRAIELDPTFARAYAGLLELRLRESIPSIGPMKPNELRTIADKLRELAPDMAATHCAQSILSYRSFDFVGAQESALKAIKADSKYELGHTSYGFMLLAWGRPIEAREQFEISRDLNAAKGTIHCGLAHTYFAVRDYTNALIRYQKVIEFDRRHAFAFQCIGETYRAIGDFQNCIDYMEQARILNGEDEAKTKELSDGVRRAVEERGARGYWEEWWKRSEMDPNYQRYWKAVYQLKLGNTNVALNLLNECARIRQEQDGAAREPNLIWLLFHEFWDDLRDDPQFQAVLDKSGFSKVMPPRK